MSRVLAVSITPNTNGLPGLSELSNIVGAMLTVGAILCVLGVILSSVVWATASTSGNSSWSPEPRPAPSCAAIAALLIGGSSTPDHLLRQRRERPLMVGLAATRPAPVGVAGRRDRAWWRGSRRAGVGCRRRTRRSVGGALR